MLELNALENTILELLLAGDDPTLQVLRSQLRTATIVSRHFTGVGFWTHFTVPDEAERVKRKNFEIADVCAEISGLDHGAGFVLFVRDGVLSSMDGSTYNEPWPAEAVIVDPYYVHHEPADSPMLRRCAVRDLGQLREHIGLPTIE